MAHWIVWLSVFILGIIIGSFLTVCVHRVPKGLSIVSPRSTCPGCGKLISWYDNVPLLSFLWLKGECRACQAAIAPRYPIIELVNGLGYLLVVWRFGLTWPTIVYAGLFSVFWVVTWIDWDYKIIPDVITLPGIVIG
ncbi:MAG: prepilin peptidase, partial [Nitrospirota bacterium]|nr:prepilin peptidase [Nitrospirota bacterium]